MKNYVIVASLIFILVTPNAFAFWPFDGTPTQDPNIVTVRQQNSIIYYDKLTNQGSWQSAPKWILDYTDWKGNPIYKPYQIWDSPNYVTFENAQASVTIEKSSCSIKIFDGGKVNSNDRPILNSISFNLQYAKNGTDDWQQSPENSEQCNVSWTNGTNGLTANMKQGTTTEKNIELRLYDNQIPELVLKVKNNDLSNTDTKYGFAVSISNSSQTITDGDLVKFLDSNNSPVLIFDTQNSINHYLWTVKKTADNLTLDYKNATKPLQPLQTLEIDPTFTAGPSPAIYNQITNSNCSAYSSQSTSASTMNAYIQSVEVSGCGNSAAEFDITSFPQSASVSSVQIQGIFATTVGGNCGIFKQDVTNRPSTTSGSTLYTYLNGATTYTTTGTCGLGHATKATLGNTAITDLKNQYSSGWYAVGLIASADLSMSSSGTQLLINYTLPVPNSVTGASCTPSQALGITCSWNNST